MVQGSEKNCVAIEVMYEAKGFQLSQLVTVGSDAIASEKTVVIKNHNRARRQPRETPFNYVARRVVHVYIAVKKCYRAINSLLRNFRNPVEAVYFEEGRHNGIFDNTTQFDDEVHRIVTFLERKALEQSGR